jgi:hypothetical protein
MDTEAIALIVDEPIAGHFYWVLQKQEGNDTRPVEASPGPMPSYGAAMMAGIAALQRRADLRGAAARVPIVKAYKMPPPGQRGPSHLH